jgi:uncharacterized membrane protein
VIATTVQFRRDDFLTITLWSVEGLLLAWCATRWRMRTLWASGLLLLAATLVRLCVTDGAFEYLPIEAFTRAFNMRALAFVALAGSVGGSAALLRRTDYPNQGSLTRAMEFLAPILIFVLLSVETRDYFRQQAFGKVPDLQEQYVGHQGLTFPIVWMIYSVALVGVGMMRNLTRLAVGEPPSPLTERVREENVREESVREESLHDESDAERRDGGRAPGVAANRDGSPFATLRLVGVGIAVLAVIVAAMQGAEYEPLGLWSPLLNYRVLSLAIVGIGLLVNAWLLGRPAGRSDRRGERALMFISLAVVTFVLVTGETRDYYQQLMIPASGELLAGLEYHLGLALAVVWTVYSAGLGAIGVWRKSAGAFGAAVAVAGIAACTAIVQGFEFQPIEQFASILNGRFLALTVAALGLYLHSRLRHGLDGRSNPEWLRRVTGTLRIAIIVVVFVLITGETHDYFRYRIMAAGAGSDPTASATISRYENLEQLLLSGAWLVYSVVMMVLGIWRRVTPLRIAAIILFGITILKIFLYDLSFLETLYRIFSFIGLGLILLGASYLYTRFKSVIIGPVAGEPAAGDEVREDEAGDDGRPAVNEV